MSTCDHNNLIINGGTMYRATDSRGRETRVCQCCHWQPGQPEKRDRDDSAADVLTAAALGPVRTSANPATVPLSDVLADLDATPPPRDPTAALAAIAAAQQPHQAGAAAVYLDVGYGYPSPKGQWASVQQAVEACRPHAEALRGFDCWLLTYHANGKLDQQLFLEDLF